ncbi:MAG: HAD-IA family hydrolase [Pirellulaceae bacterium]|nr:HAD-IA family hydrolase [Pirellulaceae bacterium]
MSEKYDGLIFDCDGTLTDSMPLHYIAWRETMAAYGIDFTEERFYAMGGMPTDRIVAVLAAEQSMELNAREVADEKESAFIASIAKLLPRIDVCDIARAHHGRIPLAVASGSARNSVIQQLDHLRLTDLFDSIVASEDTTRHKPEPDVFLEAARRLGVEPVKCLVYEDSPLGIDAAIAAGMDYVDVR